MQNKDLTNKIGLSSAIIICMNAMIGAGIFTTPAKLATSVGPAGILTFIFVIIAVIFMALSMARVAALFPHEGSFYNYAYQWGGHTAGIIASASYAIGVLIALGLLTKITAANLAPALPMLSTNTIAVLLVSCIVILNVVGVRVMQVGQFILLFCTLFALGSTTILGFIKANTANLKPFMPYGISSLTKAIPTAIFSFFGFEAATSLYNIVKDPQKNVSKAIIYSLLIVGGIYLAFISSIILSIPSNTFTNAQMPLSKAIIEVFPNLKWLGYAIGIAIITALLGVLQSMTYAVSSIIFSFLKLINNKHLNKFINTKNSFKFIVIVVGVSTLFNFFVLNSIDLFFNLTAIFIVISYIFTILTLPLKNLDVTLKQKLTTFLGLCTAVYICVSAILSTIG